MLSYISITWRQIFSNSDSEIEYLLSDPGYMGEEMFIMRRVDRRGIAADGNMRVIDAFNAMHAGHRVQVEWGIGGLRRKWRRFMKKYDLSLDKFPILFRAAAILTNYIQRRRNNLAGEVGAVNENTAGKVTSESFIKALYLSITELVLYC